MAEKTLWFDPAEACTRMGVPSARLVLEWGERAPRQGGYNLSGTKVIGDRLITLVILISIAYTISTFTGQKIKRIGVQNYVGRVKESKRTFPRHSNFYVDLYGYSWVNFYFNLSDKITQLMNLSPNKRPFYQRGQKAMMLI